MFDTVRRRIRRNIVATLEANNIFAAVEVARPEPGELPAASSLAEPFQFEPGPPTPAPSAHEPYPAPYAYPRAFVHTVDDVPVTDGPCGFDSRTAGWVLECWL